jgi:hypothetical protein
MVRSTFLILTVAAAASLSAVPAYADRAAADACAAKLPADAKLVYAETIGSTKKGIDMQEMVRSKTRGLVMGGKLSRSAARPAAEAAGTCLKQAL